MLLVTSCVAETQASRSALHANNLRAVYSSFTTRTSEMTLFQSVNSRILTIAILVVFGTIARAGDALPSMFDVMYGFANFKRLEQLKELIKQGVDINAPIGFDRMLMEGEDASARKGTNWPLDVGVGQERLDMVKLLLANGAKLHGKELAMAAFARNPDDSLAMITALLQAGADANSRHDNFTALFWASFRGNIKAVKLLLAQPGIKLDQTTVDGDTALMTAVEHGHTEIVEALLKAGANVSITNNRGETASAIAHKGLEKQQAMISTLESRTR